MNEYENTLEKLLNEDFRACKNLTKTPDNITDYCIKCPFGFFDEYAEEWLCLYQRDYF